MSWGYLVRHLGSLLIAAVFAPSVFLLTGTGLSAFESALDDNKAVDPLGALAAFGALLLAGILYAILVLVRFSPLGPGSAGMAFFAISGWALFDINGYQAVFDPIDVNMAGAVGEWGLGILLGVPLLATLTSPRRWRKTENSYPAAPQYQQPYQPYPQPAYPPPQTLQMPAQPLPDTRAPSLGYPALNAPEPPTVPVIVPPDQAPPLPKRTPTPPPAPPTPSIPDGEATVQLSPPSGTQAPTDEEQARPLLP